MEQAERARELPPSSPSLVWGRRRSVSVRAALLGIVLFLVAAVFQYISLAGSEDVVYLNFDPESVHSALWQGFRDVFWHPVLMAGLAAIHAYLNEGYLPALLLASAPVFGMHIWIFIGPPTGPFVLTVEPLIGSWGWLPRVLRIAVPWGTAGFLVGAFVRRLRVRILDLPEPI